jgi:hypothetical protein
MESISIETSTILGDAESMDAVISEVRKGRLDNTTMRRRLVHWILARRRTHGACSIPRPQERRPGKMRLVFRPNAKADKQRSADDSRALQGITPAT